MFALKDILFLYLVEKRRKTAKNQDIIVVDKIV